MNVLSQKCIIEPADSLFELMIILYIMCMKDCPNRMLYCFFICVFMSLIHQSNDIVLYNVNSGQTMLSCAVLGYNSLLLQSILILTPCEILSYNLIDYNRFKWNEGNFLGPSRIFHSILTQNYFLKNVFLTVLRVNPLSPVGYNTILPTVFNKLYRFFFFFCIRTYASVQVDLQPEDATFLLAQRDIVAADVQFQ